MDEIDQSIVRLLRANARLSQEQIAREVHLSRPAVHERLKRFEETGVLRGYQALVDWDALGHGITAFVFVRMGATSWSAVRANLSNLTTDSAFVEERHSVTGEWCMVIKARVTSPLALQDLIERIYLLGGVQNTTTMMVLSTLLEAGAICNKG